MSSVYLCGLEFLDADEGVLLELPSPAVALALRLGNLVVSCHGHGHVLEIYSDNNNLPLHLLALLDLVVAVALHAVVLVLHSAEPELNAVTIS